MARAYGPQNIRCNVVAPGFVDTDMVSPVLDSDFNPFNDAAQRYQVSPLGRPGRPEEIASAIYYLAVEGTYCNGAVLVVDESLRWGYLQTIRSYCDVPTLALVGASSGQVADAARAVSSHGRTLYVVASNPTQLTFDGPVPPAFFTAVFNRWPSTLEMPPTEPVEQTVRVYLGRAEADGRVVPIRP